MIQDCQNRPIGVTVSEWCQEHSITTANYYYRMAQVRKACLDSLSSEVVEQTIVPIPMNVISSSHSSQEDAISERDGTFVEVDAHGMKIRIHENTSSSLIQKILGALVHVE